MITFFTTPKPFTGSNKIIQRNALKSWKQFSPECEIIVFDKITGSDDIINELNIITVPDVEKFSKEIPLPLVNDLFYKGGLIAKNPICCYLNADIILPENFLETVLKIHYKLKSNYLLVGQRYDIEIESELTFSHNWEKELLSRYGGKITLHPSSGSDFIVFPKKQYAYEDIPPFVIGRPGWDNWFIYDGVIKKNKVVDISNSTTVYHQNHIAAYASDESTDAATINNRDLMPKKEKYGYFLNQSNYYIINNKIRKRRNNAHFDYFKILINSAVKLFRKHFILT